MSKNSQFPFVLPEPLKEIALERATVRAESLAAYLRRLIVEDERVSLMSCPDCGQSDFYKRYTPEGVCYHACLNCNPIQKG